MAEASPGKASLFHAAATVSGLVTEDQWQATKLHVLRQMAQERVGGQASNDSSGSGIDPVKFLRERDQRIADKFIEDGVLTRYQSVQLLAGKTTLSLGPYVITDWIAQGGMGQVFKAVHKVLGRESAVKVLPKDRSTPESRDAFLREVRLQAGLDCPYLVRAFDAGMDRGVHYLVTEYVPGTDLRRLVRRRGPLPMHQASAVIRQAALGLDYAHRLGMVHRDVKPGNILVTPDGQAKVSDMGLATWSEGGREEARSGKIVGTVDYISPEQIRRPLEVGAASDIYSLGCTMYYAVCGKVPFPGGDSSSKCRRHCEATPWHPRKFIPDLDEELVEVIADMMEKDPAKRISSAAEVAERLEPWAERFGSFSEQDTEGNGWNLTMPMPGSGNFLEPAVDASHWATPSPAETGNHDREELTEPTIESHIDVSTGLPDSLAPPPVVDPYYRSTMMQPGLVVAITLAITVPLCLLIGAILGFLFRASM